MKTIFNKSLLPIAALVVSAAAQAGVVYENGTHAGITGGNNPFSIADRYVAMDFTIGSAETLNGLTFNAFTTQSTVPVTNVGVKIYANNAGAVGAELLSGNFGLAGQSVTGTKSGFTLVDFNVALPNWNLGAGTYWIGLQADPAQGDMHWSIVSPVGYGGKIGDGVGSSNSYGSYGFEHYFNLSATDLPANDVPEPGSLALFGLAAACMLAAKRKFR